MAMIPQENAPIGAHRLRLTIEAPVDTPDDIGGVTRTYAVTGAVWASLTALNGDEQWLAGRVEQALSHRLELRWRTGINAGCRFIRPGRTFDIKAVIDPDGSRRRLVCLVEEVRS
jgi:SPP1 family predicted phage head-tail adaptor